MKKTLPIIIISALILITFGFLWINNPAQAEVAPEDQFSLFGWAWSGNIGWISFNGEDENADGDYSSVIGLDGNVTGYAWSENIGWIKFDDLSGYPAEPDYSAKVDIDGYLPGCEQGQICGWARALAGTDSSDGWDGWIRMDSDGSYQGATVEESNSPDYNSKITGWAWGSDVVGWVSMNCENDGSNCSSSDYGVETDFEIETPTVGDPDLPPSTNISIKQLDYCNETTPPIRAEWDYDSPYNLDQGGFQVQVVERGTEFNGEGWDPVRKVMDSCTNCIFPQSEGGTYWEENVPYSNPNNYTFSDRLNFDTEYTARVQVWDKYGIRSEWVEKDFKTRIRYPQVDIELDRPQPPTVEEATYFTDQTNYHDWDGSNLQGGIDMLWQFEEANPDRQQLTKTEYDAQGEVGTEFKRDGVFEVDLRLDATIRDETDSWINESCSLESPFEAQINPEIPDWEEVSPY